uniref:Allophycocyanin subunit alpha-B n=1 Tax=Lygus hesperus TaxID=30085 RepID=A0A0A9Z7S6_LYGHE
MDLNQISKDSQGCDWNEPFEIAIEDVNWGYDGNLVQQAAGGSRRRLNLGGVSRIVLEPEQPDRPQPRKMKKEKGPGDDPSSAANVAGKGKENKKYDEESEPGRKKSIWKLASSAKEAFWNTADVYRDVNPESYVIFSMRDFVLCLVFLVLSPPMFKDACVSCYDYYEDDVQDGGLFWEPTDGRMRGRQAFRCCAAEREIVAEELKQGKKKKCTQ